MRLGATITSERGKAVTKTGNEFIEVNITDSEGDIIATIGIRPKRWEFDKPLVQIGYNMHLSEIKVHEMVNDSGDFWGVNKNK
jgi:hypothetical protein